MKLHEPSIMCILSSSVVRSSASITSSVEFDESRQGVDEKMNYSSNYSLKQDKQADEIFRSKFKFSSVCLPCVSKTSEFNSQVSLPALQIHST